MSVIDPESYTKIRTLADNLIASCDGGRDYWDTINELSQEETTILDSLAFECQSCNQWYDISKLVDKDNEWFCRDCVGA